MVRPRVELETKEWPVQITLILACADDDDVDEKEAFRYSYKR